MQQSVSADIFKDSQECILQLKSDCLSLLDHIEAANRDSSDINQDSTAVESDNRDEAELRKKVYIKTVQLRELNWEAQKTTNRAKDKTSQEKNEVDQIQLDIQNIYYQHKHLKSEIERCKDFQSKHESLDLVPVEEFFDHNPSLRDIEDAHLLMLARLKDEERRRLEFFATKASLLEKKNTLAAENKKWKEDLEKLDSTLRNFIDGTDPILKLLQKY